MNVLLKIDKISNNSNGTSDVQLSLSGAGTLGVTSFPSPVVFGGIPTANVATLTPGQVVTATFS